MTAPALPPRNLASPEVTRTRSFTPAALAEHIEQLQFDDRWHPHVLLQYTQIIDRNNVPSERGSVDKENVAPPTVAPREPPSRFICQTCHLWFEIDGVPKGMYGGCSTEGYCTHHYHMLSNTEYQCCGCYYTINVSTENPTIPLKMIQQLASSRALTRTYASMSSSSSQPQPTMVDALALLAVYVRNLIQGVRKSINANNQTFSTRIGLDDSSESILRKIGFTLDREAFHFVPPPVDSPEADPARLEQIYAELVVSLYDIRQEVGNHPSFPDELSYVCKGTRLLREIVDVAEEFEPAEPMAKNTSAVGAFEELGINPAANDHLVVWVVKRLLAENPIAATVYTEAFCDIARARQSTFLLEEATAAQTMAEPSNRQVQEAYSYFGLVDNPEAADDKLLIAIYDLKVSDEPFQKATHDMNMAILAQARRSPALVEYLNDRLWDRTAVTEHTRGIPPKSEVPVGLNNIGNTCYLNSLLQYYFTLLPFRETILNMDQHVEKEADPGWTPKKIGGILVDRAEVERAKMFVSLLRDLFIQLLDSRETAISPEYDLAYMALLNERQTVEITSNQNGKAKKDSPEMKPPAATETPSETISEMDTPQVEAENRPSTPSSSSGVNTETMEISDTVNNPIQEAQDAPEYRRTAPDRMVDDISEDMDLPPSYEEAIAEAPPAVEPAIEDKKALALAEKQKEEAAATNKVSKSTTTGTKPLTTANMMFGRQQDVTECMGNVMYLVEAALRPLETRDGEQTSDMIRNLFYGKAKQILTYVDVNTSQSVRKVQEEEFSHVIVDAAEGKDLYDGLDEYFFAEKVENFAGGREAVREVTVSSFPPILQIQVQRVQFDRTTTNIYKSNAFVQFDKVIYLDRYCERNFDALAKRRTDVSYWRKEIQNRKKMIENLTTNQKFPMPVPEMLEATAQILEEYRQKGSTLDVSLYEQALELLYKEAQAARNTIEESQRLIQELHEKIRTQYDDLKEYEYRLHAVFIHQGQANYGHYWIYIYDKPTDQWWKYNDSRVSKVEESEIFRNTTGSTANPYFLVYVKSDEADILVDTMARREKTG